MSDHIISESTEALMRDLKRSETIQMLMTLRDQAMSIDSCPNQCIINDVSLDSLQFVIDQAISLIEEGS